MHKRLLFISTSVLALALAAGCGGGGDSGTAVPPPPPEAGGAPAGGGGAFDMSKATGTVAGKITFEGAAPPNEKPQMSSDPYCAQNASKYPALETVMVSEGGLENVIVYVNSGLPAATFATPATPIEINQENCHYIPHAFTMMTNQALKVKNSDGTLHNIHVWSEKNPVFNTAQPRKDMVSETKFAEEETIPIRCDVHRWMSAFVGIFKHPFHTVSKQGGTFELKLPPGNYEIVAWHEKFGKKSTMVEVKDNAKTEAGFSFNANDKAAD